VAYHIAIDGLNENERFQVGIDRLSSCTIQSVLEEADETRTERNENKWRYTKRNGEVVDLRDRFDKIIEGITKYADCINIAIQPQPEVTSLVWATARFLIQVRNTLHFSKWRIPHRTHRSIRIAGSASR
jgi:hypothetical protein